MIFERLGKEFAKIVFLISNAHNVVKKLVSKLVLYTTNMIDIVNKFRAPEILTRDSMRLRSSSAQ